MDLRGEETATERKLESSLSVHVSRPSLRPRSKLGQGRRRGKAVPVGVHHGQAALGRASVPPGHTVSQPLCLTTFLFLGAPANSQQRARRPARRRVGRVCWPSGGLVSRPHAPPHLSYTSAVVQNELGPVVNPAAGRPACQLFIGLAHSRPSQRPGRWSPALPGAFWRSRPCPALP